MSELINGIERLKQSALNAIDEVEKKGVVIIERLIKENEKLRETVATQKSRIKQLENSYDELRTTCNRLREKTQ